MNDIRKYIQLIEAYSRLDEGVIRVPEQLLNHVIKEALKVVSTTSLNAVNTKQYVEGMHVHLYHHYALDFKDYGVDYDIYQSDHRYVTFPTKIPAAWFEYRTDKKEYYFDLSFTAFSHSTANKGFYAHADEDTGSVLSINLYDIIEATSNALAFDDMIEFMDREQINDHVKNVVAMELNEFVLSDIETFFTTIEHELAHFIQYNIFNHPDQVKTNQGYGDGGGESEYWKSPVEFSPQVISAVRNFTYFAKQNQLDNPEEMIRYMIGELSPSQLSTSLSKMSHMDSIANSQVFFTTLKREKPSAYKKAVKLLYSELKKSSIL